jgi:hypothetical protein
MTDHHHPESRRPEPPTPKQLRYLRTLAMRTGTTFVMPKTKAEASDQIRRLQRLTPTARPDRRREDRELHRALATGAATSARIREDETTTTGFGATARWA